MASTSGGILPTTSSRSTPKWKYDVFLSFRGKDTRNNFISHLYSDLRKRGIHVYMDDRELERGKTIEPALWKAIEDSRFSVVVFSRDYASSPWCLDELVKIVQCMKEMEHTALPVFYDVDPSEVAEQKGNYKEPFVEHEQNFREKLKTVQSWKDCLTTVANLSGWDVRNRNEAELIKEIGIRIERELSFTWPTFTKKLVGIETRLKVLNGYIGEEANGVLFLGICGMGGMGKTTLARVVYDSIRGQFEGSCFLENVREVFAKKGGLRLQKRLLSEISRERVDVRDSSRGIQSIKRRLGTIKVLLILDDIDHHEQLEMLAVKHGWFGPGSRIIITSRNKRVLDNLGVTRIYEADKLNDDDALMLFCWNAFGEDQPVEDFREMSKKVVGYANGLPLALEVIGSLLHNRGISEWKDTIDKLNDIPNGEIIKKLRISFDGLDESEKEIFLDIACFFKGMRKDRITRILDSCCFHPKIGIRVLIEKSLISISRDKIWMHNLLQKMGQEIVRREFPADPGIRRRLWAYEDVCDALKENPGKIESIFVDMPELEEAQWNMEDFSKTSKLRLLKIRNVQLSEGPEYLSNKLRFLEWHNYPSKSLPPCLQLDMLVELDMSYSCIEQLGPGFKSSANLKIMNLSYSLNLTKTPDFTGIPNLENLNLEGCTSLSEVHPSLGHHKKLQFLNLADCKSLTILPSKLEMESLKVCTLNGCSKLEKFPDIVGNMNCLRELRLDGTGIAELPLSIQHFVGLGQLSMNNCKSLRSIPSCIGGLKSLKTIDLSGCFQLKSIPENLGTVEGLEEFDVSGTSIGQLPVSIFLLKNLKVLSCHGCPRIGVNLADKVLPSLSSLCSLEVLDLCGCNLGEGAVPEDIGSLSSLRSLDLSRNNFVSLPKSLNQLSALEILLLEDCRMFESLPEVPSNVQTLNLNGCRFLKEVPDPIKLSSEKISEFKCFDCWNLGIHNCQENIGLTMLDRYLQGKSNPRRGFGIVVPGNEILGSFKHRSKGSSISVQVPCDDLDGYDTGWMGFVACVAFSACGERPSVVCDLKVNGRENYPSRMYISCNSKPDWPDHLWLFCLSFDYLKELKEWKNESFSNIELSFHSSDQGVKVKNCGVTLVHSAYNLSFQLCSARLLVASKEAASSYSLGPPVASEGTVISHVTYSAPTSSDYQWMFDAAETSNNFTYLYTALVERGFVQDDKELEKLKAVESRLLEAMEELELSLTIFGREIAYSRWWLDEHLKIVSFMSEMRSDTVFPLCYQELWKINDQTPRSYTIFFDKYEKDFSKNKKVQRWTYISTKVAASFGSGSAERFRYARGIDDLPPLKDRYAWTKIGQQAFLNGKSIYFTCAHWLDQHCEGTKEEYRIGEENPSYVPIYYGHHTCIQITSSSYSPPQGMYDVFLSFRGKDTLTNFTSHLYSSLVRRGIRVYRDDMELERGKTIEPALWKAIEDSRFSVIVFSRDYASSPWGLDVLVKIVQCMKEMGHTVLPVFYDVDPWEVAEQKGNYKEPFVKHEQNFREILKTVQSWKDSLTTVANLSGWDVRNRNEAELIKEIVERIERELSFTWPTITKKLVGIETRLKVLNGYIGEKANGILFLGICGMGGMGKTTLARVIYGSIRGQFEGSCFLEDVREAFAEKGGLRRLQEQLLSEISMELVNVRDSSGEIELIKRRLGPKVLLILDDIDHQEQVEMLAVKHGWFGPGSRIIITSRNKRVLDNLGVTRIYEADKLNDDDAFMLFCWNAFGENQPVEDFREMSKKVVGYANGLPLALEVIGSLLHNRGISEWKDTIDKLNDIPNGEIMDKLRISFDGLDESEKEIFLDIACFFKGMKKDRIIRILDGCGSYPDIGIQVLIEKSLISISRDKIWMHNLLQKMGQEIVRREFPADPGRRSRLWAYEDVCDALKENPGKIESIFVDMPKLKEAQWNMEDFSKTSKLRLLKIRNVQLSEGPEYFSNKLRFLEWHNYPSKSLPPCLQLDMLVELDMSYSCIEQLGPGFKSSANLKIMNLSYSINLTKTPDFTGIPNLENLNLEGCIRVSEVHPSLGHHKKLQFLNLAYCKSLRILPSKLEMKNLEVFTLNGCLRLKKFPDIGGNMNCLRELCLDGTSIAELPLSIQHFVGLGQLSMMYCTSLRSIPSCIGGLKSLKTIDLSSCFELESIPENLGTVEGLEEFDVSGTSIGQLPVSIFLLKNLKVLSCHGCREIGENLADKVLPSLSCLCSLEVLNLCDCNLGEGAIPEDIGSLSSLRSLDLSRNNFVSLPKSLNQLSTLEILLLEDCWMFESLPEVPSNVQTLNLNGCRFLKEVPDPIKLSSEKILDLSGCCELKSIPENLGTVEGLDVFDVSRTSIRQLAVSLSLLKNLKVLSCHGCGEIGKNLTDKVLPFLSGLCSLEVLDLGGCNLGEGAVPEDIGCLSSLRHLDLSRNNFVSLPNSLNRLSRLEILLLEDCMELESLPEVPSKAQTVNLNGCIPSCIDGLKSLKSIDLSGCSQLKSIPENLGTVDGLEKFDVSGTSIGQLPVSIFLLKNLKVLSCHGCGEIGENLADKVLPSLSGLCSLEVLDLGDCNLGEGAVPEDIGCLSSLRHLDLSRNNFVSLPKSLNQLSALEILLLEDCRMLESLPEVPSEVQVFLTPGIYANIMAKRT